MFSQPSEALVAISIATLAAAVVTLAVTVWVTRLNQRGARAAVLSATREFYEHQMSDLARRMTATQDRWEDANHLVLAGQDAQANSLQVFDPREVPIFRDFGLEGENLSIEPDLVFVLTPVLKDEETTYAAIHSAIEGVGLRAVRSDFEMAAGDVLRQIIVLISRARIIVANVSTRNPNVYYELGIAHALGKPCIIVSRTVDEVTFDVAFQRVVTFHSYGTLKIKLQKALTATLSGRLGDSN